MLSNIKDFFIKHKLFSIGVILYLIVFIISRFFQPWDDSFVYRDWSGLKRLIPEENALEIYMPDLNIENRFTEKIPLEIFYFGIADIAEAVHDGIGLLIALIVYSSFLLGKFLN